MKTNFTTNKACVGDITRIATMNIFQMCVAHLSHLSWADNLVIHLLYNSCSKQLHINK